MKDFIAGIILGVFLGGLMILLVFDTEAALFDKYCKSFGARRYNGECVKIEKVVP
jgi:hypothetical protein